MSSTSTSGGPDIDESTRLASTLLKSKLSSSSIIRAKASVLDGERSKLLATTSLTKPDAARIFRNVVVPNRLPRVVYGRNIVDNIADQSQEIRTLIALFTGAFFANEMLKRQFSRHKQFPFS